MFLLKEIPNFFCNSENVLLIQNHIQKTIRKTIEMVIKMVVCNSSILKPSKKGKNVSINIKQKWENGGGFAKKIEFVI